MKSINSPIWLLVLNTIPTIILFILGYNIWYVINSQLGASELLVWKVYSFVLLVLTILVFLYSIWVLKNKEKITPIASGVILISYLVFFCFYSIDSTPLVPRSIPRWMVAENINMLIGSLLMPTFIYTLVHLVVWFVSITRATKPYVSFFYMLIIPISVYLFIHVIAPLWDVLDTGYGQHIYIIGFIILTVAFLFLLLTWIYRLAITKYSLRLDSLGLRITLSVIMPILGLLINNGSLGIGVFSSTSGVFGNFNSIWFYILTLSNALFFLMPDRDHVLYRLVRFIGRSVTYTFILYFVLVFLPYVPFSLPMILFFGLGLLMLTPLFLIVIQSKELFEEWHFLKEYYNQWLLGGLLVLGLVSIPLFITISNYQDRKMINAAIDYVYDSSFDDKIDVDRVALQKVVRAISSNRGSRPDFFEGRHIPYLSSYYNRIVLDNLTLSRRKINMIEAVYLDKPYHNLGQRLARSTFGVDVKSINSTSEYNEENQEWTSWIDIEIENSSSSRFGEYITEIDLPSGAWISDYYLYVGDVKEYGILTDKKSANWIYNQIRRRNRDPGLLSYKAGNRVEFKVFPFAGNEIRNTGIQFTHKGEIEIEIDGELLLLGEGQSNQVVKSGNAIYLPAIEKEALPTVVREPYFHFVLDMSLSKKDSILGDITQFKKLMDRYPSLAKGAKISFANFRMETTDFTEEFGIEDISIPFEGGFYLDKAIKSVLKDSYASGETKYPIMLTTSEELSNAIMDDGFSDLSFTYPESDYFYSISDDGTLNCHSLMSSPKDTVSFVRFDKSIETKVWGDSKQERVYVRNDDNPSVFLTKSKTQTKTESNSKWVSGLAIQGKWMQMQLYPDESKALWNQIIYESFQSTVMTPLTSYIVVENESQKRMLLKKQKQVLAGNKNMDLSGDWQQMSEPSLWLLIIALILFWLIYKKRSSPQVNQ